jgi:YEATS domain-containing protein 4
VFKLHESFDTPSRTCAAPPYEVDELGWGEFEVNIKVYFVDQKEKPVSFYHLLKLYPVEGQLGKQLSSSRVPLLFFFLLLVFAFRG